MSSFMPQVGCHNALPPKSTAGAIEFQVINIPANAKEEIRE